MNVYRLEPLDSGHASWRFSNEKETVWACAPSAESARALVAERTAMPFPGSEGVSSPWLGDHVTSCSLDPTIKLMDARTVVRQDGSPVSN